MFETQNFSKSLDEEIFESWLEKGRESKMGYEYIVIVWQVMEEEYKPVYLTTKEDVADIANNSSFNEVLVAAYDLYSESKVSLS